VDDHFCPRCGQRNAERLVSARRMLHDAVEDQLTLNAALPRTMRGLVLRPGFLTREYVEGRIARYLAPFRLYLLASVLFFVSLSWIANPDAILRRAEPGIREWQRKHPGERLQVVNLQIDITAAPRWSRPLARRVIRQQDRINALGPREGIRVLIAGLMANAPKVAFVLVPVLALLLKLLYLRRGRLFVEHFVFALHVQSFAFLLAAVSLVGVVRGRFVTRVLLAWVLVYLLLAMKRVYGGGWPGTLVRYVLVVAIYGATLVATVGALTVLSLFVV
jgi:hypothetical protein